ncbi:uncharacterized protein LOC135398304 [Ornithodoros turicata]|uniref:uncharacterized protein LOC135398304 n=1 Tax=Ornithodoros turicata TaxID=34597 RepID=UPI003138B97D
MANHADLHLRHGADLCTLPGPCRDRLLCAESHGSYAEKLESALKTVYGNNAFSRLFNGNVQHHGILNVIGDTARILGHMARMRTLLPLLKKMERNYAMSRPGLKSSLAVAVEMTKQAQLRNLPGLLEEIARMGVDILVARTHISFWDIDEHKAMAGGTMWKNPRLIDKPSLSSTLEQLQSLLPIPKTLMLSMTCGVSSFTLSSAVEQNDTGSNVIQQKPVGFTVENYNQVCGRTRTIQYPEIFAVSQGRDVRHVYIYDTPESMSMKANLTSGNLIERGLAPDLGWAVFDLQFDDCGNDRRFERLWRLRHAMSRRGCPGSTCHGHRDSLNVTTVT